MIIQKSDFVKNYPSLVMVMDYMLQSSAKKTQVSRLLENDIVVFYYTYDDMKAKIIDIVEVDVIERVTLSIYKKTSSSSPRIYAGLIRFPFDTQNALCYLLLQHLCRMNKDAEKQLKELYKQAKLEDYKAADKIAEETNFKNTFDVYDRQSFVDAINNYIYAPAIQKSIVISIVDSLANWFRKHKDKNLYGEVISRIVTLINDGNGGIIRDGNL